MDLNETVRFCRKIARDAGKISREKTARNFGVRTKRSKTDFVSDIDIQIEQFLIGEIQKRCPTHNILSEETHNSTDNSHQYTWIIDPIDGTFNFIHGYPIYSISIAMCQGAEAQLGCVFVPLMNDCYWAIKNQGAYCNENQLQVSGTKLLSEALVSTGFAYNKATDPDNNLKEIAALALIIRSYSKFRKRTTGIVSETRRKYLMNEIDQLAAVPLFKGVESSDRQALIALMERRRYRQGETIFERGDPGDSMYIILSGQVRIYTEDAQGNEFTIRNLDKMFGEWTMLDDKPRSASTQAATDLVVMVLHRDDFVAFVRERPLVGLSMMRDLAERVRYTTTYLSRVIEATDLLSQGEYDRAQVGQDVAPGDDASIQTLIAQFVEMVDRVQQRERVLKHGGG